jgi:hypothetical protein
MCPETAHNCGTPVEVLDGNHELPLVKDPSPGDLGGRGMRLVSRLSDQWGSDSTLDGKVVWFELSLG